MEPPSRDMVRAAGAVGHYESQFWQRAYPSLQILTIEQLFAGAGVMMPSESGTFMAAQKVRKREGKKGKLYIQSLHLPSIDETGA